MELLIVGGVTFALVCLGVLALVVAFKIWRDL